MPNWCQNHLELSHEDPAQVQRAYDALKRGEFLREFVPIPPEHAEGDGWYEWCVANWGTKWDVSEVEPGMSADGTSLTAAFESAWSPPIAALEQMSEQGFVMRLMYCEEGIGFAGIWDEDSDLQYDISDMTAAQLREELPAELDDMFGLSDSKQNYEDEEGEETDEND